MRAEALKTGVVRSVEAKGWVRETDVVYMVCMVCMVCSVNAFNAEGGCLRVATSST